MKYFFPLLVVFIASCVNVIFAQNDTHDSLQYVVPVQKNADIGILIPPPCFEPTKDFNGYLCIANGSAIMMQLIENVSYLQATKGMNDDFYKSNGFYQIQIF